MVPVLVTTEHRGVFFGYVDSYPELIGPSREIRLTNAHNCVAWSTDERGVFGLAVMGPGSRCRIGPSVPELIVNAVTCVCRVTPEAAERWEAGPWNG